MHRVAVALSLGLTLVLAGCGSVTVPGPGADGGPDGTPTVTPVAVPADAQTPAALAPGLFARGVYAPARLARAHAEALEGRSFTLVNRVETRLADGTVLQRDRVVLRYGADRRHFYYDLLQTDLRGETATSSRIERYADGERVLVATTRGNRTEYSVLRGPDGSVSDPVRTFRSNATNEMGISRVFFIADTRVTERFDVGGTTVYLLATPTPQSAPPLENLTLVANVTESGLVRSYDLVYDIDRGGTPTRVIVTLEYRAVGETTVSPPPWFEVAAAETSANETAALSPPRTPGDAPAH